MTPAWRASRTHRAGGGAAPRLVVVFAVASASTLACSSLIESSAFTPCDGDSDCPVGEQCNIQLGGLCEPEPQGLPPRAVLGFAIEDAILGEEIELRACDPQVGATASELSVRRDNLVQPLIIEYQETVEAVGGVCPTGYTSLPTDPTVCLASFPADISLTQPSRLGRLPLSTSASLSSEGLDESTDASVEIAWPRIFETVDPVPLRLAVNDTRSDDDPDEFVRAPLRAVVHRDTNASLPAPLEVLVTGRKRCHRRLTGSVRTAMGQTYGEESRVELVYNAPIASESSVLPAGEATLCTNDADCPAGEACNPSTGACGLDLSDVVATATIAPSAQPFEAYIYSQCEADTQPTGIALQARYGPLGGSPSGPTMYAVVDQPLDIGLIGDPLPKTDPLPGDLCIPPWPAPAPVSIEVKTPPVTVIDGNTPLSSWICCDIDECFPGEGSLGSQVPGEPPIQCHTFTSMSLFSDITMDEIDIDETAWSEDGCLPLAPRAEGAVGRHAVTVTMLDQETSPPMNESYCLDGACEVQLSASPTMPRTYTVTVEQPVGALGRSEVFTVALDGASTPSFNVELGPRTILQGQVSCASSLEACDVAGATILAERLRIEGEDPSTVVRPYVYSALSREDGQFYLPVNPGVYVLTTLPPEDQVGGPADFAVIDAREGSPEVEVSVSGTPRVDVTRGTQLLVGHSVRLRLNNFGSGARVLPYDLGSWRSQPSWPKDGDGEPLYDLNLPETCYGSSQRGCVIRQVNAGVRPLATSRAEFTVRSRGSSACP